MSFANRNFFTWFLVSLFYAYQYILRVLPNIIAPTVIGKFNIDASSLGQFSGLYYVGYTLAHIPLGILLDKYGPKLVIPISIVLTIIGTIPLIYSDIWLHSQIGRVIVGFGSAASALGIFKVADMYYGQARIARMVGLSVIIGLLGAMYGGLPILKLLNKFGWHDVFITILAIGFLLAFILLMVTPPNTENHSNDNTINIWSSLKSVIYNKNLILISTFGGFMVSPLEGFADGWATTFLIEVYNITQEVASLLPSIIFLGMCIGSFVLAYISEQDSHNSFDIIIYCAIAMIISFLLLMTGHCNILTISILLLIIGFASAYQIIVTCKALSYVDSYQTALAAAVSNMIIMIFGYFFHTAISEVINLYWNGQIIDGKAIYGKELLIKSIAIIPLGLLVGLTGFSWLKNKKSKEKKV